MKRILILLATLLPHASIADSHAECSDADLELKITETGLELLPSEPVCMHSSGNRWMDIYDERSGDLENNTVTITPKSDADRIKPTTNDNPAKPDRIKLQMTGDAGAGDHKYTITVTDHAMLDPVARVVSANITKPYLVDLIEQLVYESRFDLVGTLSENDLVPIDPQDMDKAEEALRYQIRSLLWSYGYELRSGLPTLRVPSTD